MKPIAVDLPYPKTDNICCDKNTAKILSRAYAGPHSELGAILQYVYHSFFFEKLCDNKTADIMTGIALTEMKHLDILGKLILDLGADPVYAINCLPLEYSFYSASAVTYSKTPQKMLLDNISGEMLAISDYNNMINSICNEQVTAVLARIKLDEELHVLVLKERLKEISGC